MRGGKKRERKKTRKEKREMTKTDLKLWVEGAGIETRTLTQTLWLRVDMNVSRRGKREATTVATIVAVHTTVVVLSRSLPLSLCQSLYLHLHLSRSFHLHLPLCQHLQLHRHQHLHQV